jgi:hypothetical protein
MKQVLNEGLDYMDLENQVIPHISIDEYQAKMGKDSDIITVAFTVKGEAVGNDLVDWLERGYDFVLDAEVSDGEVSNGKYLVFVEMNRRHKVPERIIEMIQDLKTLTGLDVKDWVVEIDDEEYDADESIIRQKVPLSPRDYKLENDNEEDLNEMRTIAGLETKQIHKSQDKAIIDFKTIAGL